MSSNSSGGAPRDPPVEYVTVDSAGGGIARVESPDGRTFTVPSCWLPAGAGEGDVLQVRYSRGAGTAQLRLTLDPEATARARRRITGKLDQLRRRDDI